MKIMELPLDTAVSRFFDEAERNGLERRLGQVEMSQEIAQAIMNKSSLIVEEEVGIGKSIAYLVPIVQQFFRDRRQVVIATSTIALQEQLERDVQNVLKMIGVKAKVEVAKGMKNYICLREARKHRKENEEFAALFELALRGVQRKSALSVTDRAWDKVCITSVGQKCDDCKYRGRCEYLQMRERIRCNDSIVICNQNMLVSHLLNMESGRGIFKGNLSTIVVDEAHNLEIKFRDAFTNSFSQREISREIMKVTSNRKNTMSRLIIETIKMVDTFFNFLKNDISQQQAAADADMKTFYYRPGTEIKKLVLKLRSNMKEIEMRTNRRLHSLQTLRDSENNANLVWLSNEHGVRINVCRKDIRRDIGRLLFSSSRSTILTSATLTSQNSGTLKDRYSYFMDSLGCPDDICISEPKKSPYNYDEHSMMYVSNKLPCPKRYNRNRYRQEAIAEIVRLLKITHGKTLILFTAKDDRDYVFGQLTSAGLPYKIMIQSSDSSQEQRLENFRKNVDSVILGTGTYWEGINVEGESLSQVIIFKLPFPVPEPIMEYKMSKAECPLLEVAVPEMVIKLKQGAGRLIRNAGDKGIVSILDPRASSRIKTAYREDVLSSLPENNTTENITELKRFWRKIREENKNE